MKFKQLGLLALSLVALTSTVTAADDMQIRNLENRVSALEHRRGANGMINPPARPVVKDGTNLWIQADALFMQASEDGLSYAVDTNTSGIPIATGLDGKVKNVSYDWSWGFRVGLGYNFDHDGWDGLINWTWFRSHETKHQTVVAPSVLVPTSPAFAANVGTPLTATSAHGKARLHFNLLDFELGREFFVSKWLTLRPHFGARAAWISRTFKTEYSRLSAGPVELEVKNQNRFRAGGARAGLNTQWGLGCGWSFFGDFAMSLLYGTQRLHATQDNETPNARIIDVHSNWSAVRAMADLAAGLRWDHLFCEDNYRIRLQLGWEQHMFFGFNKDMNFTSPTVAGNPGKFFANQGDLSVSGVSFQARFDF
jgi:hypothetical protein